jgi:superfamily II DNA or RNA helicase
MVPTRALLEQWLRVLEQHGIDRPGCYGDGTREEAPITVATFESAYRHMSQLGNRFDLLIVDEAHHFGHGMRDEALEMTTAEARLGLTATPPRREPASTRLAELIGPTVYALGIGHLAGQYLASFDRITLKVHLNSAERAIYEESMADFHRVYDAFHRTLPDGDWVAFTRMASRTPEGRRALDGFRRARRLLGFTEGKRKLLGRLLDRCRDGRTIIFTADNEAAYAIAREHLVMPLTCDIGRRERGEVLARFQAGELRSLVSARVLNEGVDVPDADVAIVVGASLGEREHVQRVGRLLRPSPGKKAVIYEMVTPNTMEIRQARTRGESLGTGFAARL